MAVKLNSVVRLLNSKLKIREMDDRSRNGLQVRASNDVKKIGLATDACIDTFKKAKVLGCDLVVVHHGIFWKGQPDAAGLVRNRVSFLRKNHISLYAAHLPLDKNMAYGHNAYLLGLFGVKPKGTFGSVGYFGYLDAPMDVNQMVKIAERKLRTKCRVWKFGKNRISKIAAVSGSGSSFILEAIKKDIDMFITGEAPSWSYYDAKEGRLNVMLAGHYRTETSGVKKLGKLLEQEFSLKTVFIDLPTGL